MVEIVIAMAIFAIGFVAVCAIFPVALTLQRETVDDVTAQQVGRNVKAILAAQEDDFVEKDVFDYTNHQAAWDDGLVLSPDFANPDFFTDVLPPAQRTYPSSQPDMSLRMTSWVPLVQRINSEGSEGDRWGIYTLVMTRRPTDTWPSKASSCANPDDPETIPEVASATVNATVGSSSLTVTGGTPMIDFTVGMLILDNCGNSYRIRGINGKVLDLGTNTFVVGHPTTGAAPTRIWYARPAGPGKASPLRRIETTYIPADETPTTSYSVTIDNSDSGFALVGTWISLSSDPRWINGTVHYLNSGFPGTGSRKATYTFTGVPAGSYRIYCTRGNVDGTVTAYASNQPWIVRYESGGVPQTVPNTTNMEYNPSPGDTNPDYPGFVWLKIGSDYLSVDAGTITVETNDIAEGYVLADAVWVLRLP